MKKPVLPAILLLLTVVVLSGCTKKTAMPTQYKADNENFKQSMSLLNEARDLTNPPESETQPSFELSKETEDKISSNNTEGIRLGKLVSDDYLDYMHPELKVMYKNKLIRGTEIFSEGLKGDTSDVNFEGVKKQLEGNQLIIEWIDWWTKNGKSITDKVFSE